jgi:hypothetical protein
VLDGGAATVGEGGREGSSRGVLDGGAATVGEGGGFLAPSLVLAAPPPSSGSGRPADSLGCGGVGVKLLGFGDGGGLPICSSGIDSQPSILDERSRLLGGAGELGSSPFSV